MSLLYIDDEEAAGKLNIDDLYERKQKRDLKQLSVFNKLLNRIHKRIKYTAQNKYHDQHIFFIVPEYIIGESLYDQGDCIAYLVTKLEENGFHLRYIHPNVLFVSWSHWIPGYVRAQFKKKTGKTIDEFGNIREKNGEEEKNVEDDINHGIFANGGGDSSTKGQPENKQFTPIDSYKPTGIYRRDIMEKLEQKIGL